ncbi:MAG: hypothetical protein Q9216_000098 [Gyalolechia sp. 2 TL-2023]
MPQLSDYPSTVNTKMNRTAKSTQRTPTGPDETDKRLERLKENILSHAPYLMDLTAASHYHVAPNQINNWRRVCPFARHEEQLQYMTFLPHHLRGDTLLRTMGDWDDGDGKMKSEQARQVSGGSSGAISPSAGQQPKKKISLLDYKNKMAGHATRKTSPKIEKFGKPAGEQPPARSEAIAEPAVKMNAPANHNEVVQNAPPKAKAKVKVETTHGQKRSADEMAESQDAKIFDIQPAHPPSKKVHVDAGKDENSAITSKVSNGTVHGLPRMLSPTLVASVEEGLAKMRGGNVHLAEQARVKQTAGSKVKPTVNGDTASAPSKSKSGIPVDKTTTKAIEREDHPKQPVTSKVSSSTSAESTAKRDKSSDLRSNVATSKIKAVATEAPKAASNGPRANGEFSSSRISDNPDVRDSKRSRVVVFKIPKALRKNCQRILQMQQRPRKLPGQSQSSPLPISRDRPQGVPTTINSNNRPVGPKKMVNGDDNGGRGEVVSNQKAAATGLETHKSGGKRPAGEEKETIQPSSKRQRLSGSDIHKPSTPVGSTLRSPNFLQPNSAHKSQLSTPKHGLKSTAMYRINSTEGGVQTPMGSMRSNTPTAPGSAEKSNNRDARSSSDVSLASSSLLTNGNNDGTMFKAEFNRYADVAKSLKRAADALAKLEDGQVNADPITRRQGLAIAIETTLCYMLAFTLKDESDRIKRLPYERVAWMSLLPYFRFLTSLIRDDDCPHLQGFLYQLEAVCRETILHHDFERLERDPNANDGESISFRRSMAENGKMLAQTWAAGTKSLTIDIFQREFPKTWDKRAEAPKAGNERERLIPQHYGEGGFYVPLSSTSSGIEAVRAGWSFLGEWCEKESVQWDGKTGL